MAVYGPKSDFIFKGKIRILHTSTTDSPDAESMGVVQVMDIIKAPPNLSDIVGRDITVLFSNISEMAVGKELILYSIVGVLGDEIAVTEVGNMAVDDMRYSNKALQEYAIEADQDNNDAKLRELVHSSELILYGTVTRTVQLETDAGRDSEHDPMWTEAIIEVDETLKGNTDKTTSFVFAASSDVAWYQYPKFREGDKGVFLLRRQSEETFLKDRLSLVDKAEFYKDKESISKIRKFVK
ncbi:MAG: hypothetical protein R2819_12250 [Allomuricauda sp.]